MSSARRQLPKPMQHCWTLLYLANRLERISSWYRSLCRRCLKAVLVSTFFFVHLPSVFFVLLCVMLIWYFVVARSPSHDTYFAFLSDSPDAMHQGKTGSDWHCHYFLLTWLLWFSFLLLLLAYLSAQNSEGLLFFFGLNELTEGF